MVNSLCKEDIPCPKCQYFFRSEFGNGMCREYRIAINEKAVKITDTCQNAIRIVRDLQSKNADKLSEIDHKEDHSLNEEKVITTLTEYCRLKLDIQPILDGGKLIEGDRENLYCFFLKATEVVQALSNLDRFLSTQPERKT